MTAAARAYQYIPNFRKLQDADVLFEQMQLEPWRKSDGGEAIHYGQSYTLKGGGRFGEVPIIPAFFAAVVEQVSQQVQMPVNYVQCHRMSPAMFVTPHRDPAGMIVPMLVLGQERTFRVGGTMPYEAYQQRQSDRLVDIHRPEEEILLQHGSLLVFNGGQIIHSMFPANRDPHANLTAYPVRISILFRYTTDAMRAKGTFHNTQSQAEYEKVRQAWKPTVQRNLFEHLTEKNS